MTWPTENLHIETLSNSYRCSNLTQHEVKKKREANAFNCILQYNDLEQLIDVPTHEIGGTLDLLIIQNEGIKMSPRSLEETRHNIRKCTQ